MDVRLIIVYVGWIASCFILMVILICTPALWSDSHIPDYCSCHLIVRPYVYPFLLLYCLSLLLYRYFIVTILLGLSYCLYSVLFLPCSRLLILAPCCSIAASRVSCQSRQLQLYLHFLYLPSLQ